MNKKIITLFIIYFVVFTQNIFANNVNAKVTKINGTVTVQRKGSSKTFSPFENMTISVGDTIVTNYDGAVEIALNEKNTVVLNKNSSMTLSTLSNIDDSPKSAYVLNYGSATNDVKEKGIKNNGYKVNTTNTVMGVRGTVFEVSRTVLESGKEEITLITADGEVSFNNRDYVSDKSNELVEKASVKVEEMIVVSDEKENSQQVQSLDVQNLKAEQLRWLKDNEQYLSESTLEEVVINIEEAEKAENEKVTNLENNLNEIKENEKIEIVEKEQLDNYNEKFNEIKEKDIEERHIEEKKDASSQNNEEEKENGNSSNSNSNADKDKHDADDDADEEEKGNSSNSNSNAEKDKHDDDDKDDDDEKGNSSNSNSNAEKDKHDDDDDDEDEEKGNSSNSNSNANKDKDDDDDDDDEKGNSSNSNSNADKDKHDDDDDEDDEKGNSSNSNSNAYKDKHDDDDDDDDDDDGDDDDGDDDKWTDWLDKWSLNFRNSYYYSINLINFV